MATFASKLLLAETGVDGDTTTVDGVTYTKQGTRLIRQSSTPVDAALRTDMSALMGVTVADRDLGTFTGTTIPDNATVKGALQAVETAIEGLGASPSAAPAASLGQRTFHIVRGDETVTAPTQAEIDAVNGSAYVLRQFDVAEIYTPTRTFVFEHNGTAWDAGFQRPDVSRVGVFAGASTTFAGLPTSDLQGGPVRTGDLALLSTADGANPRGFYRWAGGSYILAFQTAEVNFPGSYIGTAATFAALPTTSGSHTVVVGDWVWLSADDGANLTGAYVWNGTAYARSWGIAATGVPSINTVLATLPADTWTNVPISADVPDPHHVTAVSDTGILLDLQIRQDAGGTWQAQSSTSMTNVQFTLWR